MISSNRWRTAPARSQKRPREGGRVLRFPRPRSVPFHEQCGFLPTRHEAPEYVRAGLRDPPHRVIRVQQHARAGRFGASEQHGDGFRHPSHIDPHPDLQLQERHHVENRTRPQPEPGPQLLGILFRLNRNVARTNRPLPRNLPPARNSEHVSSSNFRADELVEQPHRVLTGAGSELLGSFRNRGARVQVNGLPPQDCVHGDSIEPGELLDLLAADQRDSRSRSRRGWCERPRSAAPRRFAVASADSRTVRRTPTDLPIREHLVFERGSREQAPTRVVTHYMSVYRFIPLTLSNSTAGSGDAGARLRATGQIRDTNGLCETHAARCRETAAPPDNRKLGNATAEAGLG